MPRPVAIDGQAYLPDGSVFRYYNDAVEGLQQLTVHPPLYLKKSVNGSIEIGIEGQGELYAVVLTGIYDEDKIGVYEGRYIPNEFNHLLRTNSDAFEATDLGPINLVSDLATPDAIVINPFDKIAGVHTLMFSTNSSKPHIVTGRCVSWIYDEDESNLRPVIVLPYINPGLIRVTLSGSGGTNGSKTTAASYTYIATLENGVQINESEIGIEKSRSLGLLVGRGTLGIGTFTDTGFKLWDTNERYETGGCPS